MVALGLVGIAGGLLEGPVFFHPVVLSILPAIVTRFVVVVAIGAGLAAAALGCVFYVETPAVTQGPQPDLGLPTAGARTGE